MSQTAQETVTVTLPDGKRIEVPHGASIRDVAFQIGKGLGKVTVGGRIDGQPEILDLRFPITSDCSLSIVTATSEDGLEVIRHSAAHVLAEAVLRLWPDTKLAIGPAVDGGFYYDLDLEHTLLPEDFEAIEAEMKQIVSADTEFVRVVVDREQELERARERDDVYKAELLEGMTGEVTFYRHDDGKFEDVCRGPHVPTTGFIKAFKILRVAGAYWRGDEKNKMLQRIYGTAFYDPKELKRHLRNLEEAAKRDHRKLGKELGLFMLDNQLAPAMPIFLPKGTVIYHRLQRHMRELYRRYDYQEVITPQIFDSVLWHKSGHYDHYKDNMYFTHIDDHECAVKPMNCPSHALIFAHEKRSYRDLPLRIADFGRLHRYERSGATSGLTRVRTFCQDDGHLFCTTDQIQAEITDLIKMINETYALFGFEDVKVFLSTRPEKSTGSDETWEKAESALEQALRANEVEFAENPGDGAFYGPKIDFVVRDALRREWQLGTIQLDFSMPERFDLKYTAPDGSDQQPVMIHRAILGSLERFIGILIEHTGGKFPFWIAPVQARMATINDSHVPYARDVLRRLEEAGFRMDGDLANAKIGAKIREARLQRIPYVLVAGDREVEEGKLAVREHPDKNLGSMTIDEVVSLFTDLENHKK